MKNYMFRTGVKGEDALGEVERLLDSYGLKIGSTDNSIASIMNSGKKIGYVWCQLPQLTLEITSPEGLNIDEIERKLDGKFNTLGFYVPPAPKPDMPPIEVVRNGRSTLVETESSIGKMVRFLYETSRKK